MLFLLLMWLLHFLPSVPVRHYGASSGGPVGSADAVPIRVDRQGTVLRGASTVKSRQCVEREMRLEWMGKKPNPTPTRQWPTKQ